jgi:hypothetical protein
MACVPLAIVAGRGNLNGFPKETKTKIKTFIFK